VHDEKFEQTLSLSTATRWLASAHKNRSVGSEKAHSPKERPQDVTKECHPEATTTFRSARASVWFDSARQLAGNAALGQSAAVWRDTGDVGPRRGGGAHAVVRRTHSNPAGTDTDVGSGGTTNAGAAELDALQQRVIKWWERHWKCVHEDLRWILAQAHAVSQGRSDVQVQQATVWQWLTSWLFTPPREL